MKTAILALSLTVAACGKQAVEPADNAVQPSQRVVPSKPRTTKPAAPVVKPFSVEEENDLYSFSYSWPGEAAAVPQLAAKFTREMEEAKSRLVSDAKADRDERRKQGFDFHPYESQLNYETAGQSSRLLSLQMSVYAFTGGAHGSSGSGALLWDRQLARQISIPDLLEAGQSWTGAIRQPFCVLLDREREERRGEPVRPDDMFGECPKYDELTVVLSDEDKNGRFDHILVTADQYVAGPYVEGDYEISLPITAAMIERLKPEYRPSFEPKPPVK